MQFGMEKTGKLIILFNYYNIKINIVEHLSISTKQEPGYCGMIPVLLSGMRYIYTATEYCITISIDK